ncbi:T9SS type B sorting domain-containing protein [Sphingobacterium sp. MYb382]|uniref:T9SS type B sorting domain-containing protein n=1 Tax=Sphingobacterium sp. MYb382 TaxID=2745278 RepID=UPI0030A0BAD7
MKRTFLMADCSILALERKKGRIQSFFYFLLLSWLTFMVFNPSQLQAQTLNVNDDVPRLSACSDAQEFTVRIDKGQAACPNGQLVIHVPAGLEYVAGSAKVDGLTVAEANVSLTGASIAVNVPAGPRTESVKITFQARAKCESLSSPSGLAIAYTLNGCNGVQNGTSNAITILSAVLQVSVTPDLAEGILGDEIVRTITVKNNGNGTITGFTVPATHGNGLQRISGGETNGWTYDPAQQVYRYNGTLQSGAIGSSVSFVERVKILSCDNLTSTYRAYYGCTTECVDGSGTPVTATIKMSLTKRPNLRVVTGVLPEITCFNTFYSYSITIENTGTVDAIDVNFTVGTADGAGSSYIVGNSVKLNGSTLVPGPGSTLIGTAAGDLYGTTGQYASQLVKIPLIPAGGSVTLMFDQYYATPVLNSVNCSTLPNLYTRGDTYYSAAYVNSMTCDEQGNPPAYTIAKTNLRSKLDYSFAGGNIGEVDIVEGTPYEADFKIDNLGIPIEGLAPGAFFEMKIKLSPNIQNFDPSAVKLFKGQDFIPNGANGFQMIPLGNNEYSLRVYYGTPAWPSGQAFSSTDGSMRLQFPLTLTCPAPEFYYEISTGLNKGGTCATVSFNCPSRVDITAHCDGTCPGGGLANGVAKLKRITLGFADANNDAKPDNNIPLDPNGNLSAIEERSFVGGDIIEIYQKSTVAGGDDGFKVNPSGIWNNGKFVVNFQALPQVEQVPNGGTVKITRGSNTYTVSNIPVTKNGNLYQVSFNIANWLIDPAVTHNLPANFNFLNGDIIESALQVKVKTHNATSELKIFPATSSLTYNGIDYSCAAGYRASGYYGSTTLTTSRTAASYNVPGCSTGTAGPAFTTNLSIGGRSNRNALFFNEFRQLATLKKVTFTVPQGLTLTGYRVEIVNNAATGTLTQNVPITPFSGGNYEADLKPIIESLKGGTTGGYLDEGFIVHIRPTVSVNCDAKNTETIIVNGVVDGTFRYSGADYYNATDVATGPISLVYNTDNEKLVVTAAQASVNTITAEANWRLTVRNTSTFHTFQNLWLAKVGGVASTQGVRLQRITSLTDTTHIGAPILLTDDLFQVGAVAANATVFYMLTANFSHCGPGDIEVVYGNDCAGYPTDVATVECKSDLLKLSYVPEQANLQTVITKQPAGASNPKLCAPFEYVVEINNAGGQAKELFLDIPIHELAGLEYVPGSLRVSGAYPSGQTNPAFTAVDDQGNVTNGANGLRLSIPTSVLPKLDQGNRFYISFQLVVKECDFESGHAINVTPGGKNFCGSPITEDRISSAQSNRIIMKGAPDEEPVITFSSSVDVKAATDGTHLYAEYNLRVANTGTGAFAVPITGQAARANNPLGNVPVYSFAIDLPAGWEIDDTQQELIAPNKATYLGKIPGKGYAFQINQTIEAGQEIDVEHIRLIYRANDAATLACGYVFGRIHEQVLAEFTPESDCPLPNDCKMNLLTAEHFTDFVLQQPTPPAAQSTQVFCETAGATLADIVLTDASYPSWFASQADLNELPATTVLEAGKTYYVSNHFVEGALCASDRIPVTINLDAEPVVTAGTDQVSYNSGTFTLNGSQPTGNQTGLWTVVSTNLTPVLIANPTLYNTTVTVPVGATVDLKWTVTNGTCEATDSVQLKFARIADLVVDKKADKTTYQVGETITYTITVTNNGPGTLFKDEPFLLQETLPTGLLNPVFTASNGSYDVASGMFTPSADVLPTNSVSLVVAATIAPTYEGTTITNKVHVEPPVDVIDPDDTNNDDEETTAVTRVVDLAVTKVADKTEVNEGDFITYTITVSNQGPSRLYAGEVIGIKESLPIGLTEVTYTTTSGSYDEQKQELTLANDFNNGDMLTLIVKAKLTASSSLVSNLVNQVDVSVPDEVTDPELNNNHAEEVTKINRVVDLTVIKKADKTQVNEGDFITYTITVSNLGLSNLYLGEVIGIKESLPNSLTEVSFSSLDGVYDFNNQSFTLSKDLLSGSSIALIVKAKVLPSANVNAILINKVDVSVPDGVLDPNPDNNHSEETTKVIRTVDLAVTKTADKAISIAGDLISYVITVNNQGPSHLNAGEVIGIKESLPEALTQVTFSSPDGDYDFNKQEFTLAKDFLSGTSIQLIVNAKVLGSAASGASLINKVDVTVPDGVTDPDPDNNHDEEITTVDRIVDLAVTKVADKATVVAGEFVTYTITVTNNGLSHLLAGEAIGVKESLPTALTQVTFTSPDGTFNAQTQKLTLAKNLENGAFVRLIVKAKLLASTTVGSSIVNTVDVSVPDGVTDPDLTNNHDEETILTDRNTDLVVVKTVSNAKPVVGTETTFTIKVTNNGPSDATGVKVTDVLPNGYTYVNATATKGSYVAASGIWTVGDLVVGTSATLTIVVKVAPVGIYKNQATVTGNEKDPDLTNNESSVTPVPLPSPPIAVDDKETTNANTPVDILILNNDRPGLSNSPLVPSSVEIISQPKNGRITIDANGKVVYTPNHGFVGEDTFVYRVKDELGYWSNEATVTITIVANDLFIPNIFTPNGDGTNDTFEIVGIEGFDRVALTILNRWGNEVYRNESYDNKWAGRGLNEGTYYYIITLHKSGTQRVVKGWVIIKTK